MRYGLLKEGEGYSGLNVRAKPGGRIDGVLRPKVKFYLTGGEVTHSIEWVKGFYFVMTPQGEQRIEGWVARTWLDIHEEEPQDQGPVDVPCDVEIPARFDGLGLFRSWPEALWHIGPIVALAALFLWWFLY